MNDGGTDLAPGGPPANSRAEVVSVLGMLAYYDHYWNDVLSSSIGYSFTEVDNTSLQLPEAFHKGKYASANLLYTPIDSVLIEVELLWGQRTDNDGAKGEDVRLQFSAKYSFGIKL